MEEAGNFVVCCYSHMKCFHVIGLLTDKVDVKFFFICKGMLFLKIVSASFLENTKRKQWDDFLHVIMICYKTKTTIESTEATELKPKQNHETQNKR